MKRLFSRQDADRRASPLSWRTPAIATAVALVSSLVAVAPAAAQNAGDWPMAGQNLHNTRSAAGERAIGLNNVAKLAPRWSIDTDGNVSATPTVVAGVVYVPDFGG
ncbi:hypothetical protein [Burkholderia anthina]|uniref:hypothetical protein n=1 Tax=Burkholderia anthina TaxID=179879 RepID=UPI0037C14584